MLHWLNFLNLLFWCWLFIFLINPSNLVNLLLYSEIAWMVLYLMSTVYSTYIDDLNLQSLSFFVLCIAAFEFCVGFVLAILFKNFNLALDFDKNFTQTPSVGDLSASNNNNKFFLNRYIWNKK